MKWFYQDISITDLANFKTYEHLLWIRIVNPDKYKTVNSQIYIESNKAVFLKEWFLKQNFHNIPSFASLFWSSPSFVRIFLFLSLCHYMVNTLTCFPPSFGTYRFVQYLHLFRSSTYLEISLALFRVGIEAIFQVIWYWANFVPLFVQT